MKKQKAKIPEWGSDEAIAKFWDTHDISDYLDELETVDNVKFTPSKKLGAHLPAGRNDHGEK